MRLRGYDHSRLAIASRWRVEAGLLFAVVRVVFARPTPVSTVLRLGHAWELTWRRVVRRGESHTWLGATAAVAGMVARTIWPTSVHVPLLH